MRTITSSALSVSGIALMSAIPVEVKDIPETGSILDPKQVAEELGTAGTVEVTSGDMPHNTNAANLGEIKYQHVFASEEELEQTARTVGSNLWSAVKSLETHRVTEVAQIAADYYAFRYESEMKINGKPTAFDTEAIKSHLIGTKDKVGILFRDVAEMTEKESDANSAVNKEKYPYLTNTLVPRGIRGAYLVTHGYAVFGTYNNQLRIMMRSCDFIPNFKNKVGKEEIVSPNVSEKLVPLTAEYIDIQYAHRKDGKKLTPYGKLHRDTDESGSSTSLEKLKGAKVEDLSDALESNLGSVFSAVKDKPEQLKKLQNNLEAVYDKVSSVMGATLAVFVRKTIDAISRIPDTAADLKPDQFEKAYGVTPTALQELRDVIRLKLGEASRVEIETLPVLALKEALSVKLADSTMLALTEEEQESLVQLTGLLETFTGANKARKAG